MKKRHIVLTIVGMVVLGLITFVLNFLYNNHPVKQDKNLKPEVQSTKWMESISDDKLLSEISIPGSHDSGSLIEGGIYEFGRDQNLNIANQLKIGVRFFDLRLGFSNHELNIYHGFLDEKLSFISILTDFTDFLDTNPSETILMCIKHEHGEDIHDKLKTDLNTLGSSLYTENRIPTLGEVRGKIVLVRRYQDDENKGLNLYNNFADNTTFDLNNGFQAHVQDYYNLGNNDNLETKYQAIVDCFEYSKASEDSTLVINFTSAYIPLIANTPLPKIQVVADYIHPRVKEYLETQTSSYLGIVLFDFVNEELSSLVYQANF